MCGIMGYYCFGKVRPSKERIEKSFIKLASRGTDASGFAFLSSENVLKVFKKNVSATLLTKEKAWAELDCQAPVMIFHTRAATKGKPNDNNNNHPIFTKKGLCLIHNGMVDDGNEEFEKIRDGEVDSEILVYYLSKHKTMEEGIAELTSKVNGSYAIAVINKAEPTKLMLCRNNNPTIILLDYKDKILYFASTKDIALEMAPTRVEFGVTFKSVVECDFPDENWNIIDTKGMGANHKFKGKSYRTSYTYSPATNDYNRSGYTSVASPNYKELMTVEEYFTFIQKKEEEENKRIKSVFVCETLIEGKSKECNGCEYITEEMVWCKQFCAKKTQNIY